MKNTIDCLIIGHNESNSKKYFNKISNISEKSGAFRDLNLSFIQINNEPYHMSQAFNLLCANSEVIGNKIEPFNMLETFSPAIAYLGTYLKKHGFSFDFINSYQDEKERLIGLLEDNDILSVAITTTLYLSIFPLLEVIELIKKYNKKCKIIVGGPFIYNQYVSLEEDNFRYLFESTGADIFIISSQGESTLVKTLNLIKNKGTLSVINNIYYKDEKQYASTILEKESNDLSDNMVDWDLFENRLARVVNVRTAISCSFSCAFCRYPSHAGKFQPATNEAIMYELDKLNEIKSVKSIYFIDDTFNFPVKRFKDILKLIIKRKYTFKWHSYFRCQFADSEMVELMKESGCEGVYLGLESGNNEILKNMRKNATVEQYLEGISLLNKSGIITFGSFIIGFPGETLKTVDDTIRLIKNSGIDFFRAHTFYYESVAPLKYEREKYNIKGDGYEWEHITMNSKTASDIVDDIFLNIKDPIWIPQYNFNFDNFWHLIHRNISIDQGKKMLTVFNDGIREKLINSHSKNVSPEIIERFSNCLICNENHTTVSNDLLDAEFNFS